MEKLIYEAKPLFAFAAAVYTLTLAPRNSFIMGCGMILLFCALYIYKLRIQNRRSPSPRRIRR